MSKPTFPHKLQYAMNLSNKSPGAVQRVNDWAKGHGGNVEHLSTERIFTEVKEVLRKDSHD
jgi:hypothetical protein